MRRIRPIHRAITAAPLPRRLAVVHRSLAHFFHWLPVSASHATPWPESCSFPTIRHCLAVWRCTSCDAMSGAVPGWRIAKSHGQCRRKVCIAWQSPRGAGFPPRNRGNASPGSCGFLRIKVGAELMPWDAAQSLNNEHPFGRDASPLGHRRRRNGALTGNPDGKAAGLTYLLQSGHGFAIS